VAYKEKQCEQCNVMHTRRGRFCSRMCSDVAGKNRKWTAEQKKAVSDGLSKWHATSDIAAVTAHDFISKGKNQPAEPVPPIFPDSTLDEFRFVSDGDLWEEIKK